MHTSKFSQFVIYGCLLLSFLFPHQYVYAQDSNFVEIPLDMFHDGSPVELLGLVSSQTLNIPIPENWLLGDTNWIEIQLRASPLLDSTRSSFTVLLNDLQITSYSLAEIPATKQRLLLPARMFRQGNNTLTFTGTLYLPDDPQTNCQNWDDPSRWLAIEPGGLLHLSFAKDEQEVDLSNFPQILIEPLEKYLPIGARKQTLIVLPKKSTHDDLTSVSTLSYVLGGYITTEYDWHPEIVTESQVDTGMFANRNIIFIGEAPDQFQDRANDDKDYVAVFPSPWGVGNSVMIIGDQNRQDGFSPASVFSDHSRRILLQGNVAYVEQDAPPALQPFQHILSFEDLGYLDRTVRGIGPQNLIYRIYIPYDVEPALIKLNLGLVHSPELDIQNSSFTVYLNGHSIAGILPTDRSSTGDPITIGLPAKNFRRGINFIRVGFDLHLPDSSCERGLESVWATVLSNSTLETTYRNSAPIPSLEHFPLPFSDQLGLAFVIPDQYSPKDLVYISRLSFLLGDSAHQPNRPPEVMTATEFQQKETKPLNVILVGLPSDNSVTRNTNNLLLQPFREDGNSLQDGYGIYLPTSNNDASLGLMQIIPSPWVKGGAVLVLTGNDDQGLDWTWNVILNPALQDQFAGNLMVVGSENRNQISEALPVQESPRALFQQIADVSNIPVIGPMLQRSGQAFLIPAFVGIGSALFLTNSILSLMNIQKRRKTSNTLERREEEEDET